MSATFSTETTDLGDGITVVAVSGELDQATVAQLRSAFDPVAAGEGSVLLDLSGCEFIDSSGLAALVTFHESVVAAQGRAFAVCCPGNQVRRLLELTGLDQAMEVSETRDDALAVLRGGVSPEPA